MRHCEAEDVLQAGALSLEREREVCNKVTQSLFQKPDATSVSDQVWHKSVLIVRLQTWMSSQIMWFVEERCIITLIKTTILPWWW